MKNQPRSAKKLNSAAVPREHDSRLWWKCLGGLVVGILLVCGFAVAAQQHFTAHQYGVRNVELQRERERLRNERQRLLLAREAALSPLQLEKKAQKIGMKALSAEQINVLPEANSEADDLGKSF